MFTGWLLGSATLHAAALVAIPFASLTDGVTRGDTVQVVLSAGDAVNDLAIDGLSEMPGMEAPEMTFPQPDDIFDSALLDTPLSNYRSFEEAGFSSLDEAFEKDRQVLASLDAWTALVTDETLLWSEHASTPAGLAAPATQASTQRSALEPVASLEESLPQDAATQLQPAEFPVPIERPASHPAQSLEVAPANSRPIRTGEVATASSETRATGDPVTAAATDLTALISLLHEEIARHKQYPAMAKRQHREGTATVSFALHPDGGDRRRQCSQLERVRPPGQSRFVRGQ